MVTVITTLSPFTIFSEIAYADNIDTNFNTAPFNLAIENSISKATLVLNEKTKECGETAKRQVEDTKRETVVNAALSYLGTPYVYGGASPSGIDCSGLVLLAYKSIDINLPHYTVSQFHSGTPINEPKRGDLVFFGSDLHHVGIYIGDGQYVHAPHTGDVVKVSSLAARPYSRAVSII